VSIQVELEIETPKHPSPSIIGLDMCVTQAGVQEGHVHDVIITKEAPNYWLDNSQS
jgi:hypothetical protein